MSMYKETLILNMENWAARDEEDYGPEYHVMLKEAFQDALKPFESGEGFDGRRHRTACIYELMDAYELCIAKGVDVMSFDELTSITGDF